MKRKVIYFKTEEQIEEFLELLDYWFLKSTNNTYLLGPGHDVSDKYKTVEYASHIATSFDELSELTNRIWLDMKQQLLDHGDDNFDWVYDWINENIHPIYHAELSIDADSNNDVKLLKKRLIDGKWIDDITPININIEDNFKD